MKQVLQNSRTGDLKITELPVPAAGPGQVLVRNAFSVVSPGTERSSLAFARKSMPEKAASRPDLVEQVTKKLRQEGPLPTYRAVMSRLDAPAPLGYSSAGTVVEVGEGVTGLAPGDRVACAGAGYANHAEFVSVPMNLVARVPDGVGLDEAAYATIGAIALQAVRIAEPTLGEIAAVIGLGLIGQLEVQLLAANGCRVLGADIDPARVKQATEQGADWAYTSDSIPGGWAAEFTHGFGVDLAIVAASSKSTAPLTLAASLCRMKGRISIVGDVPIEIERRAVYDKELDLRMSMSYGPGRYDRDYEELGRDFPLPYVRWTENRNMQAVLGLLSTGSISMKKISAERVEFDDAVRVYDELAEGENKSIAILFEYDESASQSTTFAVSGATPGGASQDGRTGVAVLGAGNYAKGVLLPAIAAREDVDKRIVVTATGASGEHTASRFGFQACSTDVDQALSDPAVSLAVVATRHDSHAELAHKALLAGKAVWLEKPIGIRYDEVQRVIETAQELGSYLFVGYNRRFSSHARKIQSMFVSRSGALSIDYQIAAGPPPEGTWVVDREVGGGRIIGEVCHFVDLCSFLVGSPPRSVYAHSLGGGRPSDDSTVIMLEYPDRSVATISYLAKSHPGLPKERFEVSGDGRTAICDNFRSTRVQGGKAFRTYNQDKGQATAIAEVLDTLQNGQPPPITFFELEMTSRVTFAILESIETGQAIHLDSWEPTSEPAD